MTFQKLQDKYSSLFYNVKDYPVPSPFCINKKKVKGIVLGCDPSNRSDNGKTVRFCTVFGIGTADHRYFRDILSNLKSVGLSLENIYVQNVIPYYMKKETTENNHWNEIADMVLPKLIKELDDFDKKRKIPVFMTSEIIYKFMLLDPQDYRKPKDLYNIMEHLPVKKEKNKLGRKLFPLYRHYQYRLSTDRFTEYKNVLSKHLY
jgi:hypothetical protein